MPRNLTEQAVFKLKSNPNKRLEIADGVTPGLRLRISTNGKKSWYLFYKVAGANPDGSQGKNSRISLGSYPLVNLKGARRAAEEALDFAARGKDPKAEKQVGIDERVFSRIDNLLSLFIEHHAKPNTKMWKETNSLLTKSMLPYWRDKLIGEVTCADFNQLLDTIKINETAAKAREVHRHVSVFMNWCADRGYAAANPMAGLRRKDLTSMPKESVLELG